PIIRLADMYLLYAEALNEYSGPSDECLYYIDQVRQRSGLQGVKESWMQYSINPEKPSTVDGLREIIHRERTIELAFEGERFWDIRRWKKIQELNEQPLGWNIRADNQTDFYQLVPLAQTPVKFSVRDYFWPIKENELTINSRLIQNLNW
ncbi:MAG: RagB/SusD family nutrient uptake outer membrane protein, partial [Tannerellaceae bacterium]